MPSASHEKTPLLPKCPELSELPTDIDQEPPSTHRELSGQPARTSASLAHRGRVKSHWQLSANCAAEDVKLGFNGIASFQNKETSLDGEAQDAKLIKYSDDVGTFKALMFVSGTVLMSKGLWRSCAIYWVIAALCSIGAYVAQQNIIKRGQQVPDFSESFETMANYFTALIGFMISMFVTTLFGRWWAVRTDGLGGLWGAVDDLIVILSIHMPSRNDRAIKERILRLGLLSHRLVYAQAQNLETREHLKQLVNVGLMTVEELDVLEKEASKPQAVWVWIGQILHALAAKGKIQCSNVMLPKLDKLCVKARGSIGLMFAYTDTQVPFAYVHLLVLSIIFSNCLIAFKCGLAIGFCFGTNPGHEVIDSPNAMKVMVQVCHLAVIPFFYHAFVHIGLELANPLGIGYLCLPGYSYHIWMRNENMSFMRTGERTPESLLVV